MTKNNFSYEFEVLKFWEEKDVFNKVLKKNKDSKKFIWVEGPPYPTGEAHLGHMRNWAVKDTVLRFKRLQGHDVYAKDGYDVHGLPVEQKVQKKLDIKDTKELKDKFGVDNFINECRKYVAEIINDMKGLRKRYGFWIDNNHYQTSDPRYISFAWRFFKKAQEKGMLYKDYKCVAWSPGLETTLSDYEVKDSYAELEDPSVYVRFKVLNKYKTTSYDEYLLIWTTTPWTLEANQAIAINKDFKYAKVLVDGGDEKYVLIIGEPLVKQVIEKLSKTQNIKSHNILQIVSGIDLVGIRYEHIYPENITQKRLSQDERYHRVLHADFVSLGEGETHLEKLEKKSYKHDGPKRDGESDEDGGAKQKKVVKDGTGLAHEAPAHGMEDFELCRKEGLKEAYCVVDERGNMISESKWFGKNFRDSNKEIIDYLLDKKIMLHNEWRKHTYPLCWRCKVPIVYRTTEQWYVRRSEYAKDIISENKNVNWFPDFAQTNFNNLMEGSGDWAISRQRFWGIPIPIFEDEKGNYEVFGSKEELEKSVGKKLEDVHLDNLSGLEYKGSSGNTFKHVGYTCDVWFDSGCASFASHYGEGLEFGQIIKKYYPMTWITEGEDQIRGWFSSLFNVGFMVTDKAPYEQVLFQGFVMAKDGSKMSKSLGNGITGNESLEMYGADASRYYLLTKSVPEGKLNFDMDEFSIVYGYFNTIENIFKLVNPYLEEHELRHSTLTYLGLSVEDKWILYRLNITLRRYLKDMNSYRFNTALNEVEEFLVRDFSKTYLKLVKERLDEVDENLLVVLNEVLKKSLIMISPSIPFLAEKLYQDSTLYNKKESIFLEDIPEIDQSLIKETEKEKIEVNFDLAQDVIQAILNAREKAKIGVRWPLGRVDIASITDLSKELGVFENLIKKLTNVSKISYDTSELDVGYIVKPNFKEIKDSFQNVSEVVAVVNKFKEQISDDVTRGVSSNIFQGIELDYSKHIIKEMVLKGDLVSSEFSRGTLILETKQDEILLEEGYLRELYRRVQDSRKSLGLNKKDQIALSFSGSDDYYLEIASNWESSIKKKVGAADILSKELKNKFEYEIKDKKLVVSIG